MNLRRFLVRRGPDLLVAGAIVGWIIACKSGKKAPAEPNALAEAKQEQVQQAPAAPPEPTTATVAGLELVAARGECREYGDFAQSMTLARDSHWDVLKPRVSDGALVDEPAAEWLVLAHHYQQECGGGDVPDQLGPRELLVAFVPLPEKLIDKALEQKRCGFLASLDQLELWPYEVQFAEELQERDFAGAEVTRTLWRDSLNTFVDACGADLPRRRKVGTQTQIAKLDRIIGLDDSVLIELRSKMLSALEKGNADQILAYSRAISEREKALDSRHSEQYEEKLREVEAAVAMQEEELATAREESKAPTPPAKGDNGADLVEKTANAAKTAKNVHDTVKTAKSIGKLFGL